MVLVLRFVRHFGPIIAVLAALNVGCSPSKGMHVTKAEKMASKSKPLKQTKKAEKPDTALADAALKDDVPKVNVKADDEPMPLPVKKQTTAAKPAVAEASGVTQAMVKQVGRQLATANPIPGKNMDFDTVLNRRPDSFHTPSGTVYLSTGMLEQLKTEDELATVLALEIARLIAEQDSAKPDESLAKLGDKAEKAVPVSKSAEQLLNEKEPAQEKVVGIAQKILTNSGFKSDGLASMQLKLDKIANSTSKPRKANMGPDPRVQQMFNTN